MKAAKLREKDMVQTIGYIGSDSISSQVAGLATAAGINVLLSNSRSPDTLVELVAELGNRTRAATSDEAARDADLIVASIQSGMYRKLPAYGLAGKIVIGTMNYYPERDGNMSEVATDKISTSELVQRHLAKVHVVRALNNMDWVRRCNRARLVNASDRSALPVAGNEANAKAVVTPFLEF
jgi:predicted dinucleotide-binding enzyme